MAIHRPSALSVFCRLLTSSFLISDFVDYNKLPKVPYKKIPDYFEHRSDSMLFFTSRQAITEEEWFNFLKILDGSYYWKLLLDIYRSNAQRWNI